MYSSMLLYLSQPVIVPVYNEEGDKVGDALLPDAFRVPVRKDLIRRAFLSEFTARLQPKGRDPMAGKRTSAESVGAHHGVSRVPRVKGTMRGALVNMTRGGRLAHPPRVEKRIHEEINKKEKRLATMSALAATAIPEMVRARGHVFTAEATPVVVKPSVLSAVEKTQKARELLDKLGILADVERARRRTRVRAGKGKMRGRRLKKPVSILFILSDPNSPLARSVSGLPGVTVATPSQVSVLELAPGGVPGRLTVIDERALEEIGLRFRVKAP
ncbi:MAG: 50S ribosomal protein L4 [Desulfurococcales archaeon]|nr:50S ribosomal protein L4 [Desulfurococcales archaeon]